MGQQAPAPTSIINPLQLQQQKLTLQQMANQSALSQQMQQEYALKNQETQRALDADKALGAALAGNTTKDPTDGSLKTDYDGVSLDLTKAGYGKQAMAYDAQRRADLKTAADQMKAKLDANAEAGKQLSGVVDSVPAFPLDYATNPQALNDYKTSVINAATEARNRGVIDDSHLNWVTQGAQNPTPQFDASLRQYGKMGLDHATQMTDARNRINDSVENHLKDVQTQNYASEITERQRAQDASVLAAAARVSPDAFQNAVNNLPYARAKVFVDSGATNPDDILKIGMKPNEAAEATTNANKAAQEKVYQTGMLAVEKGKLGVEQAKAMIENKKFIAEYGTPDTRSAFTQSVINDPDSYFSLPPTMKPGVAADLVSRGLNVPVQLPGDLKSRVTSAALTQASIGRIRSLLNDPDIQNSIGPIAGRIGNGEQMAGAPFFGQDDPRAAKEQQLRTELQLLKYQEAKGLIGGRLVSSLVDGLGNVSPNNKMSEGFINGALNAIDNNTKAVGTEAHQYSFGGASNAVAPPPLPSTLTLKDKGKVFINPLTGKKVKITDVDPKNGKNVRWQDLP